MSLKTIWVPFIAMNFLLLFLRANSEEEVVRHGLVKFMEKLAPRNVHRDSNWGWNLTSDPCTDKWYGVICHSDNKTVMSIVLESSNLSGVFDATSLSMTKSLMILSLQNNSLHDLVSEDIGNFKSLTHLFLSGNHFSGEFPITISQLSNLKRLHISDNSFSGEIPNMSHVSGLISFHAENNNFSGVIPDFDFNNLKAFNVSYNNLNGPVPDVRGKFNADSFFGNPGLCGKPLPNSCPNTPPPSLPPPHGDEKKGKNSIPESLSIYSGWLILCVMVFLFFVIKMFYKLKTKKDPLLDADDEKGEKAEETSCEKPSETFYNNTSGSKSGVKSEYSLSSLENGVSSSGLVLLTSPKFKAMQFEELLSAPAELVWRGNHGSLYKVMIENGVFLAVKRIKDWGISKQDFETRMELIAQVKHPNVLPLVAYYCSQQEKLLVYEFLQNGSLFMLLYGSQHGQSFDWWKRLNVAANIAEALAHMHEELHESGIAHGNLKSSNILFDNNMNPLISEYGLMIAESRYPHVLSHHGRSLKNKKLTASAFKADTYAFGVVLLELLTGKVVKNDGFDLAKWVNSVVREEWTIEVFDKALITQGASEERLMSLLQVALNCINPSPNERPSMSQVSMVIKALKENDENSITFEASHI